MAEALRTEWEESQTQKIKNLEKLYLASLRNMGEGHQQAKENVSEHLFDYFSVVVILVKSKLYLLNTCVIKIFSHRICFEQPELCKFNIIQECC